MLEVAAEAGMVARSERSVEQEVSVAAEMVEMVQTIQQVHQIRVEVEAVEAIVVDPELVKLVALVS
jgi:hypothetical protein